MRISPRTIVLATASTLLLGACGGDKPAAGTPPPVAATAAPVMEGELVLLAWPGYAERGETGAAWDWVTPFEQSSGCKLTVRTVSTPEELLEQATAGGVDAITASGDLALRLIAGGNVQPLDLARVASWRSIDPRLQDAPWHTVDGAHYGIPFQWGPNLLVYNTRVFDTAPTSWGVVFEPQQLPDGKPNKGRVQALDNPILIADAALYLSSKNPELGITDPYALNEAQYTAALDLLRKQKSLVHRYWRDPAVQVDDFQNQQVVASSSWNYQLRRLKEAGAPFAATVPAEGATGWADSTMLAAKAAHPNCAYAWMEWTLQPKVQGDVAAFTGSVPVVAAACSGNPQLGETGCQDNGMGSFDQLRFWRTPAAKCGDAECVPFSRWTEDYLELVGG
jgi:putative spermidine/putrescine transport system substrate-binding protein